MHKTKVFLKIYCKLQLSLLITHLKFTNKHRDSKRSLFVCAGDKECLPPAHTKN